MEGSKGNKRTCPSDEGEGKDMNGKARRKAKMQEKRSILTMPLPASGILVESFVETRAFEISAMKQAMESSRLAGSKRAFQILPRHLRRRAASHNPKRVPRSLRARAMNEHAPGSKEDGKTKKKGATFMKRYTRRTLPLRLAHSRRQRNKRWLETHIWHAKRCHMKNMWGFRMAEHINEKAARSSYKAAKRRCIIHDASYQGIIQLSGPTQGICHVLNLVSDPNLPRPSALRFRNGYSQCTTWLYRVGEFPAGKLCSITVLWKAVEEGTGEFGMAWILTHPAVWEDAWNTVNTAAASFTEGQVTVEDLRGELNIFQFIGPQSMAVLQSVLQPIPTSESSPSQQLWKEMSFLRTTASMPPGKVWSLAVQDPRLKFPPPKIDLTVAGDTPLSTAWSPQLVRSSIWDAESRKTVLKSQPTEVNLNRRKERNMVPGDGLTYDPTLDSTIPILLFQRGGGHLPPASPNTHSGLYQELTQGISIILPKGWGLPFWRSFIFTGLRYMAQREMNALLFEATLPAYPVDTPECPPFWAIREEARSGQETKDARTPQGKRVNYSAHCIDPPLRMDMTPLLGQSALDWSDASPSTPWILPPLVCTRILQLPAEKRISGMEAWLSECPGKNISIHGGLARFHLTIVGKGAPVGGHLPVYARPLTKEMTEEEMANGLLGYVTTGGYSLAHGSGYGIVVGSPTRILPLLSSLAKMDVWVRGAHDRTTRKATLAFMH